MQCKLDDIILYPTDTVYGLGVDATNPEMVRKLKELKGRGDDKYFSIAVSDVAMLRRYVEVTPLAERLMKKFLPGKLTLILNKKILSSRELNIFRSLASGLGSDRSIGIRIPARKKILAMIKDFDRPMTATSANVSGMPTERTVENIFMQFGRKSSRITCVIDGGELPESLPSTIVDARGEMPIIVREGAVHTDKIFSFLHNTRYPY